MGSKIFMCYIIFGIFCIICTSSLPTKYDNVQNRFKRDTNDTNTTKIEAGKKSTLIDDIQSILDDSTKILRSIIEIKSRVLTPLIEGIGETLDTLNKSEALDRTMEAVSTVGEAGIKASTGIASAIIGNTMRRTGNSTSPSITKVVDKAGDIGGRLVRLGICGVVCPLQNDQERKECFKKNCGKDGAKSKQNKSAAKNKEEPVDVV